MLIFVIVFASVAQGSFADSSSATTDSVLPQSASEGLNEILVNQEETVYYKFAGFNPIFDVINEHAAALIYNMTASSDGDTEKIAGALVAVKKAIDHSVDSFPIALRKSCACVEPARNQSYLDLEDAYAVMSDALTYAEYSNFTDGLIQIEKVRIQAQYDLNDLVVTIYDCLRTCMDTTSDELLEVTEEAQSGSGLALVHVVNAVVNAIKAYAAAYAAGSANASLIMEVEGWRSLTLKGLRSDVENKFSGLKALYIDSYLNESSLALGLDTDQYTNTVAGYRYAAGIEIMFSVIKNLLRNVVLGFSDAGKDDFSAEDAAREATIAKWDAATDQILTALQSNSESIKGNLSDIVREVVTDYFKAFDTAMGQSSNGSVDEAALQTLINNAIDKVVAYVQAIFDLLRAENNCTDDIAEELKTLQEDATEQINIYANSILNGTTILAKATSETVLQTAVASVSSLESQAIAAVYKLANIISYGGILVLRGTTEN